MKAHKTIMVILVIIAVILIVFSSSWGVGRGYGLLLLICPLMMFVMISSTGGHKK